MDLLERQLAGAMQREAITRRALETAQEHVRSAERVRDEVERADRDARRWTARCGEDLERARAELRKAAVR